MRRQCVVKAAPLGRDRGKKFGRAPANAPLGPGRYHGAGAGHYFTATKASSVGEVSHCHCRHSQEQHQDSANRRLLPPKAPAEIDEETFGAVCHDVSLG